MAVLKGVYKALLISVAVLAVLILIVVVATFMARSSAYAGPIMINTINLRNVQDPVKKAQLISALDELVAEAQNAALNEQWSRVTACLGSECPDDAFFDTVFVVASEFRDSVPNSDLIMNVLFVNRYWDNDERVVEFSKSLAAVDADIPMTNNRKAERAWSKVIECNNVCSEKNDQYFELLYVILQ